LAANRLDENLLSFIEGAIPSVWALELLILLRGEPRRPWTSQALTASLRASEPLVGQILASFERSGLAVRHEQAFHYGPPAAIDDLCRALEAAYRERPVAVVNAIVRRRSGALDGFADAFRLKGPKT
jgi:hypothetical protein